MSDLRIQFSEEVVGANHGTKADTINRLALVEHNNDGTHKTLVQNVQYWATTGSTTVTSGGTTISTHDMGTVAVGDVIYADTSAKMAKGATGGETVLAIQKYSGTATIQHTKRNDSRNQSASATVDFSTEGIFYVTVAGTLFLCSIASSAGSNATIAIGDGQFQTVFLKKA